jgi:hypothetical protein
MEETRLVAAIRQLHEKGLVTQQFTQVLDHVRKLGNLGAHAADEPVSPDEARLALDFTTQVLRNLFEIPAELDRLAQRGQQVQAQGAVTGEASSPSSPPLSN